MTVPVGEVTAANRRVAVEKAIALMRERLDEPQDLRDIAQSALMSPSHFHRVFRTVTRATPRRFLTALRMAEAKRLLIETTMSATDVSVVVGYSSFGTFTTQFARLVGLPPGRFRACAAPIADLPVSELFGRLGAAPVQGAACARGLLSARPDGSAGVALAGLFPSGIPQCRPLACALAEPAGRVALPAVGVSGYVDVLAVSFDAAASVRMVLTESQDAGVFVGSARAPVRRREATPAPRFWIRLRAPSPTDPPLLLAFPLLAAAGGT